jgi:hypothetical protein
MQHNGILEDTMKSKAFVILSTLVLALGLMAQTTTQSTPATGTDSKAAACCDHAKTADGKAGCCAKGAESCCGKDAKCCNSESLTAKDGKEAKACPMMAKAKDGKSMCCASGKCAAMAKGSVKGCCGTMCERPQAGM